VIGHGQRYHEFNGLGVIARFRLKRPIEAQSYVDVLRDLNGSVLLEEVVFAPCAC